jgi:hypothetical protein
MPVDTLRSRAGRVLATGYPLLDADVARLSPYMRRHINFHGHCSFAPTNLAGERRALREPDEIEETSIASATPQGQAIPCEVETNLVDLLVPAGVLHEQGDLDAVIDV